MILKRRLLMRKFLKATNNRTVQVVQELPAFKINSSSSPTASISLQIHVKVKETDHTVGC